MFLTFCNFEWCQWVGGFVWPQLTDLTSCHSGHIWVFLLRENNSSCLRLNYAPKQMKEQCSALTWPHAHTVLTVELWPAQICSIHQTKHCCGKVEAKIVSDLKDKPFIDKFTSQCNQSVWLIAQQTGHCWNEPFSCGIYSAFLLPADWILFACWFSPARSTFWYNLSWK